VPVMQQVYWTSNVEFRNGYARLVSVGAVWLPQESVCLEQIRIGVT
jgi:hypothetical protein